MTRRLRFLLRLTVAAFLVTVSSIVAIAPALAGGSWLEPERDRYEPGETATLSGYVGPGQLGWIEDEGCKTGIGDLIGGTVWVGVSRSAPVPETTTTSIAPSTTTSLAPTTTTALAAEVVTQRSDRQSQSGTSVAVVLAVLVALATLATLTTIALRKRSPARTP